MASRIFLIAASLVVGLSLAGPAPGQGVSDSEDEVTGESAVADEQAVREDDEEPVPELSEDEKRLADAVDADAEGRSGEYEQEEDDDFVPTQEVSSDQSVSFPVDI